MGEAGLGVRLVIAAEEEVAAAAAPACFVAALGCASRRAGATRHVTRSTRVIEVPWLGHRAGDLGHNHNTAQRAIGVAAQELWGSYVSSITAFRIRSACSRAWSSFDTIVDLSVIGYGRSSRASSASARKWI